ncbi:UNVERIFIED_CONTAM: hypothetical protein RMT77_002947 [Armadillidium vulgare]
MSKSHHSEKDLDCTNCGRGVWLVKVPKYIREKWTESPPNAEVGRLKVTRTQSKLPSVTFTVSESNDKESKLPKEHKFILHSKETLLGVFSQTVDTSNDSEKVFMEGHVIQKFECQPVVDSNYLRLKREAVQKALTPLRQAVKIDHPHLTYKPRSNHTHTKEMQQRKKEEGKKSRDDREKVQEMLFAAFEKHQYYNIKDLEKITAQPITYLKEILKEMCDYNLKNPHKNMWELKPEYRHYKEGTKRKREDDDDDSD